MDEQRIEQEYKAALDSVAMIESQKPNDITDEEWLETLQRNIKHLKLMVSKDYMKNKNLIPLKNAINSFQN